MKTSGKNHRPFYESRSSCISSSLCISGTRYTLPRTSDVLPVVAVKRPEKADSDATSARMVSFYYDWDFLSKLINYGFYGKEDDDRCFSCGYCRRYMESIDKPWNDHVKWDTDYSFTQQCSRVQLGRSRRLGSTSLSRQQDAAFKDTQQSYATRFDSTDNVEVLAPTITDVFTRNQSDREYAQARDLEEKELCKMCHDKEAWMVFHAYCHVVTCAHCAHALK